MSVYFPPIMTRALAQEYLNLSNAKWDALSREGLIKGFLLPQYDNMMYGKKHLDSLEDRLYRRMDKLANQLK